MMYNILLQEGWPAENIMVLRDNGTDYSADKAWILWALKKMVDDAGDGDVCFLHYSGHGGQTADAGGSEIDGMDEFICPSDGGIITDDELKGIVEGLYYKNCVLFGLFDCCHSGTMLDL